METAITVETNVKAPIEKVWKLWTQPQHITKWYNASDDWHAPSAENDLQVNGKFKTHMAAKDGSEGFDFEGIYTNIREHQLIEYTLGDNRKVKIAFSNLGADTHIAETFETENTNPVELQRQGWQAILNNFKKYTDKEP